MARRLLGGTLVIATHNPGKLAEMAALLAPYGIAARSAGELGLAEPDETGASFEENAALKARDAARPAGCRPWRTIPASSCRRSAARPASIPRAGPAPTRISRRPWRRVEHELRGKSDRSAYFVAVLALAWPDGHVEIFRGEVHGSVVLPPRGARGFGYDPIFLPEGQTQTFGELDPAIRQRVSHRAAAFRLLAAACLGA